MSFECNQVPRGVDFKFYNLYIYSGFMGKRPHITERCEFLEPPYYYDA